MKAVRCMYESWDKYGRLRVNVRRCKNRTTDPSWLCWRHRPVTLLSVQEV